MNRIEHISASAWRPRRCLFGCLVAASLLAGAATADATSVPPQTSLEQWQLRRLNEPSARELAHERKGNIYIYDGLTDREVDAALIKHFGRIEYMMFVGTRKTGPAGEEPDKAGGNAETESPGCL
jgi:hypothetical protein